MFFEFLRAVLYGIIEGITEWLPISSTGHLLILGSIPILRIGGFLSPELRAEYEEMFDVVIQLGAILAVLAIFGSKLIPSQTHRRQATHDEHALSACELWKKLTVASLPAAFVGILVDRVLERLTGRDIDVWLYTPRVVAAALILYGAAFILVELLRRDSKPISISTDDITYAQAFIMGCFQALAIVPGTSRSGSTVLGACCLGISRTSAAEFSFLMALPAMLGAGGIKCLGFFRFVTENRLSVPLSAFILLATAFLAAFVVSLITVRFLIEYVKKHTFTAFGIYRILLGIAVAALSE